MSDRVAKPLLAVGGFMIGVGLFMAFGPPIVLIGCGAVIIITVAVNC